MKFLHISDLHLGRKLANLSLIDDQEYIINQILDIAKKNQVGAFLVAGDIYDRGVPPVEATKILNYFLEETLKLDISVYMIGGNHDSIERLSFGGEIFKYKNIYICHRYDGKIQKEPVFDEFGNINIYLMPFVTPIDIRLAHKNQDFDNLSSLTDYFNLALNSTNIDSSQRNILISHQLITATPKDKEDFIDYVGGTENIDAHIFGNLFDYIALGHVHKPYWIVKNKIKYSGAILQYSIDESENKNSVTIIDFKEKGNITFESVELKPLRKVRVIKDTLKSIIDNPTNTQDYVSITLTDEDYIINAIDKLRAVYPNILNLSFENSRTKTFDNFKTSAESVQDKSILDLFSDFYNNIYEEKLESNQSYVNLLKETLQELENKCNQ